MRSLLLAAACACASFPALSVTLSYAGRAIDPDTGKLLYVEQHLLREEGGNPVERLVNYRCATGGIFARKSVDYRDSLTAPAFELHDVRDGYREGLRRRSGAPWLFMRDNERARQRTSAIEGAARLVADAGFDEFVKGNRKALLAGETATIDFAVPANLRVYKFKLRRLDDVRIGKIDAHVFRLKLGGLLGLVTPQIDVAYASKSGRLLRFEGVTNLRDGNGKQWTARVEFPDRPPAKVADGKWQQALGAPLRACR